MAGPILLVEADPAAARLMQAALAELGRPLQHAADAAAAAEAIALEAPALIVLDLVLPDADGRALLARWRSTAATAHVPVVALAVSATPEIRSQCGALGVAKVLEKPCDADTLAREVGRLLHEEPPAAEPGIDPVTGVASRAALAHAYRSLAASLAPDDFLAAALIDIDRFRAVNDTCGRRVGDAVLRGVAELIRTSTGSEQVAGRWQADQFMALLPGVTQQEATSWLERCLDALRRHSFSSGLGTGFNVTFSGGVVEVQPADALEDTVSRLLGRLYAAKASGRARIVNDDTRVDLPATKVLHAEDDDVVAAVVRSTLEAHGLVVEHHRDGAGALEAARKDRFDLFLLDVDMPRMDGFELLVHLRSMPAYARVPIAMLTSAGDEPSLERAVALGADDYLVKPVSAHELIARVQHLLTRWVEGRLHELQGNELYRDGIELLHRVFDKVRADEPLPVKDLSLLTLRIVADLEEQPARLLGQVMNPAVPFGDFLAQHSLNSAILATIVGQEVDVEGDDLDWLCVAALLHEIGCVRLPDGLLQKTGDLSAQERALLERRPEFSHEIINKLAPEYADAAKISLQVHERPDGTGYPEGLSGDQITLEAQILGAVEVFEALTHHRPYRDSPQAASEAVKYLLDSSSTQFLDRVLKALIAKVGLYPVGSYVRLSTDEIALVLEHREENPMRPLLAVVTDRAGRPLPELRVTDAMLNPQIHIRASIAPPDTG